MTKSTKFLCAALALASAMSLSGCGVDKMAGAPAQSVVVPPARPAADLSNIDQYVDADPVKPAAIMEWVEHVTVEACRTTSTDGTLRGTVQLRSRQAGRMWQEQHAGIEFGKPAYLGLDWPMPKDFPIVYTGPGDYPVITPTESWCAYKARLQAWPHQPTTRIDLAGVDRMRDADPAKAMAIQMWIKENVQGACLPAYSAPDGLRAELRARATQLTTFPPIALPRSYAIQLSTYPIVGDAEALCDYEKRVNAWPN